MWQLLPGEAPSKRVYPNFVSILHWRKSVTYCSHKNPKYVTKIPTSYINRKWVFLSGKFTYITQ